MTSTLIQLAEAGQSPWYDNIARRLLENGGLAQMIAAGDIRGVTSNPSIFHQAIAKSHDYDSALVTMAWAGYSSEQIFDRLAQEDIQAAADLFTALYQSSQGGDGYVSLEVSPTLAHDTAGTVAEAKRLWAAVNRPNLMIKIPATSQGVPAVRQAIAAGLNVNVTLIFSLERYLEVMDAYLSGLEDRLAAGGAIEGIASVASFFISRIDSKVDKLLQDIIQAGGAPAQGARSLLGKLAIANAKLAYQQFRHVFSSERFARLRAQGARLQRPLWASTSTKNPDYPDTLYVDALIGPDTVNTLPPQTVEAFRGHGRVAPTLESDQGAARRAFELLAEVGISMQTVTSELEAEGVKAFADAFAAMLKTLEERRQAAVAELGPLAAAVPAQVAGLQDALARMYAHDAALWTQDEAGQAEIRRRLGWLTLPQDSRRLIPELQTFAAQAAADGFTHVLLLGMGGSSLGPEVLNLVYGPRLPGLKLSILDSTDPGQVAAAARQFPARSTLYIVSSKSGGTAEVNAMLDYFWARAARALGSKAGSAFIAITDPGTSLEKLAQERQFRAIYAGEPTVGGRFSVLSIFGLLPAALMGIDLNILLGRAAWMAAQSTPQTPAARSPGVVLGAILGEAARQGRDKLTLLADELMAPLGAWLEQLVAESSGKLGLGIVPVDAEPAARPVDYGNDRLFVYLRSSGRWDALADKLRRRGLPVLTLAVSNPEDVAAEFYRWEIATVAACVILGVNPFDQPNVQDNKTLTLSKIAAYRQHNRLEEGQPDWQGEGVRVYAAPSGSLQGAASLAEALVTFLAQTRPGDYVAINAYLPRNRPMTALLQRLRKAILLRTGRATTLGFGPRFLHSTGQLHKGGADNGVFLQITADPAADLPIPGQGLTFGTLEMAQALGDFESLATRGRRALRIHLPEPAALRLLVQILGG